MPVIFLTPEFALPHAAHAAFGELQPALDSAGWVAVRAGDAAPGGQLRDARAAGRDLLFITSDPDHLGANVLAEMAASRTGQVDVDVVLAIPGPQTLVIEAVRDAARAGHTWAPDRACAVSGAGWAGHPPTEIIAPILRDKTARVHALPMDRLPGDPLSHLLRDLLGLSIPTPPAGPAPLLRADLHRLVATCLWRDSGLGKAPDRAAFLARLTEEEVVALEQAITTRGAIARRPLHPHLPEAAMTEWSRLAALLRDHWTADPDAPRDPKQRAAELTWHDPDALLSIGAIADPVARIVARSVGADLPTTPALKAPQPVRRAGPRILGLGHSHIGALDLAWKSAPDRHAPARWQAVHLNAARLRPNFTVGPGPRRIAPTFQDALTDQLRSHAPDLIVALPMGNEYNALAMTPVGAPFTFTWPDEAAQPPEAGVWQIPLAMIRAQVRALADRNALLMFAAIEAAASCPVVALPPPPPIRDAAHIRAHPGRFAAAIDAGGLNPADLRGRFWRLYCEVLSEGLAKTSVTVQALPEAVFETHAGQRFLAPGMQAQDPTHGNAAYGAVLLGAVMERLDLQPAAAA